MILYVNGDSHTAAAEAVNPHAFAEDDGLYYGLGRRPHPDNERVSWGCELANHLRAILWCDAESASSNDRIMRTTREWLQQQIDIADTLVVIQWSTWERQEWQHDGTWYQVNASGMDDVPPVFSERYRDFVIGVNWQECQQQAHDKIWQFHQELKLNNIRHLFFNGNSDFSGIKDPKDWGVHYMAPYDPAQTYDRVLKNNGFQTVNPKSWHFGQAAHCFWAEHVLQYINDNNLIVTDEIRTD
jgi:hypothetical protein